MINQLLILAFLKFYTQATNIRLTDIKNQKSPQKYLT